MSAEKIRNLIRMTEVDIKRKHKECQETNDDQKCEVIDAQCEHFIYQLDRNGEVAISHCTHPDNKSDYEGNCTHTFLVIEPCFRGLLMKWIDRNLLNLMYIVTMLLWMLFGISLAKCCL